MITLSQNQKNQSDEFRDLVLGTRAQLFGEYLGWRPNLYNGVDLERPAIDYLNNYYWDYEVNPKNFHNHYLNALRKATPIYKNLRLVEFNDKIFDITTNQKERDFWSKITDKVDKDGTTTSTRKDTGTINDTATSTGHETSNETGSSESKDKNKTKNAEKQLPMQTTGTTFNEIIDWSKGGSGISENRVNNKNNTQTQNNTVSDTTGNATNIRTLDTEISKNDIDKLIQLNDMLKHDTDNTSEVNGQAVDLIKKICDYLVMPKAIDYLTEQVKDCFILVY